MFQIMLTALTRRLIKEGLISIYREHEDAMSFPVYYLPSIDKEPEEIGLAARALQSLDSIPWPEEDCVIFTEDPLSFMLNYIYEEGQVANMLGIVKEQKLHSADLGRSYSND